MSFSDMKDELNCSICLSIYIDPVTLRCGHSFCDSCIRQVLDSQESSGAYSCPDCRKRFKSRPSPLKTTTLCNIVKHFQSTSQEQSIGDIFCTYCMETPVPAAKSCLLCEASLCTNHLCAHSKSPEHVLVAPTTYFQKRKCFVHSKVLDYISPLDATCVFCAAGAHRRDQAPEQAGPSEKQNMTEILEKLILKRKIIVDHTQGLLLHRQEAQSTADRYMLHTTVLFGDLKRSLSALEKRILNEILRQEEQVSSSVDNIIKQLEVRKNDVTNRIGCVKEICNMTCNFPVSESEMKDFSNIETEGTIGEHHRLDEKFDVDHFVPILISETLQRDLHNILTNTKPLYVGSEAVDLLLDADTAGNDIVVSRDKKTASWSRIKRKLTKNPERFRACNQVLSTGSFSPGRYYWEIETSENSIWRIGVTYPSIDRRSLKSRIGDNEKSWCLCRYKDEYSVRHDEKKTALTRKVLVPRLGIYLDSWAGTLSFYELGDPIEQLYTFKTTFSEPLCVVLYLGGKGWLRVRETC
ncbi:E3 ubiquitin/ISG15 ligase TRIM25-like [Rhinoderma darwinii]|uniref:E3 ubiquitin/ISG15 ligase TRIM25-like n=1 Tax=Rhinoderma darwinii TaxID=43563 RepID=UPI003F663AB6